MRLFGYPLFGVILPFIGFVKLPVNPDGTFPDTGKDDLHDEVSRFYIQPLVFEWLTFGFALPAPWPVYDETTGQPVT